MRNIKIFAVVMFVVIALPAFSQMYKPWRFGMGLGLGSNGETLPGILVYMEPSYRLNDKLALGIRVETLARSGTIGLLGSYSINGQYYFAGEGELRLFAGLGVGIYTPDQALLGSCTCESLYNDGTILGFYPRTGFDAGHFVLTLEYNLVQSVRRQVHYGMPMPINTPPEYYDATTSYFSLKFGFFIGGGKRKKDD